MERHHEGIVILLITKKAMRRNKEAWIVSQREVAFVVKMQKQAS